MSSISAFEDNGLGDGALLDGPDFFAVYGFYSSALSINAILY